MVVIVHGGGILTAERIKRGRQEGFVNGAVRLTNEEITELLKEKIEGRTVPVYSYDDFASKTSIPANYGIVLDLELAQETESGQHLLNELKHDSLFITRAGGIRQASQYLDRAVQVYAWQTYGNRHYLKNIIPNNPEGRLVYLNNNYDGIDGNNSISNNGRFVGVQAPEAHGAR